MSGATRAHALLAMTSPLGPDVLIPTALTAEESISRPFRFEVSLVSARQDIDVTALLNQPACVVLRHADTPTRYFHGVIASFVAEGGATRTMSAYRAVLTPKMAQLGLTSDCRIYQRKTVEDILTSMLSDVGVTGTAFRIFGAKTTREYTVQFNETDLHFASRLMEEEGWFYFFEHTADAHTLVVTDANTGFTAIPGTTLRFDTIADDALVLTTWITPATLAHGASATQDYDPGSPDTKLYAQKNTLLKQAAAPTRDVYTWPALTLDSGEIANRARRRMEAAEAAVSIARTQGSCAALFAGGRFVLAKDPRTGAMDVPYVVQSIVHDAQDESWTTGGAAPRYANSFAAFPNTTPWRQPMATPRPRMDGLHSAIVLGPGGEDINVDDQGRVKVRFFWDHRKDATADTSCWARVVQPWAGPGWGAQFIPRVGTEVAVSFMDADPDRPVVIGGFYNGRDKPIFPVAEKTKSGLRTRSSIKGGTDAFSELSFDDKNGQEMVLLHAQKDLTTTVENDQTLSVDNDRKVTIKGKETLTVTKDRAHEVSQGNDSLTVTQGNLSITVQQGNMATEVKLGDVTVKATAGSITLQAMQSLTLKVGQSSVTLDNTGVTVKGMTISVAGTLSTEVKGVMTKVGGDAMLTLKGGIMMIN